MATSSITRILIGNPATASITNSTITMIIAVPRSGCSNTRTIGMPAMISSRNTSRQASPSSARRAQYDATARMRASTANSDGCSWRGPTLNQRAAPWALLPTTNTPSSDRMISQYRIVATGSSRR